MLKLNYTDVGVHMEYVAASLETVMARHIVLSVRLGLLMHIEPSRASFLLPMHVMTPRVQRRLHHVDAECLLNARAVPNVSISRADSNFVEVSIAGLWIYEPLSRNQSNGEILSSDGGTFLSALGMQTECLLHELWTVSQPSFVC